MTGKSNYKRMAQLAEDVYATKNDPEQLDVNNEVLEHLKKIHPSTVSVKDEGNGPVAWLLMIPTTSDLMNRFLKDDISEKELFELTPLDKKYDALYLCSALVLEEYRRKGIIKQLALDAIKKIRKNHPIKSMFVWAFTDEGNLVAENIALWTSLPLLRKSE